MKEMVGGCCVCSDERGWDENPLVYCDGEGCCVAVHQACYGIVTVPPGPWFCRKCELIKDRPAKVHCDLCPNKDGAFKKTDSGGWAHVVCALYIPEVRFENVTTMEPILTSLIPQERYNRTCYICEVNQKSPAKASFGAFMECNKAGCKTSFHVTCAQYQGLLCEEAGNMGMDNVKYCGYCQYHSSKLKKSTGLKIIPPFKPATATADLESPDKSQQSEGSTSKSQNISPDITTVASGSKKRYLAAAAAAAVAANTPSVTRNLFSGPGSESSENKVEISTKTTSSPTATAKSSNSPSKTSTVPPPPPDIKPHVTLTPIPMDAEESSNSKKDSPGGHGGNKRNSRGELSRWCSFEQPEPQDSGTDSAPEEPSTVTAAVPAALIAPVISSSTSGPYVIPPYNHHNHHNHNGTHSHQLPPHRSSLSVSVSAATANPFEKYAFNPNYNYQTHHSPGHGGSHGHHHHHHHTPHFQGYNRETGSPIRKRGRRGSTGNRGSSNPEHLPLNEQIPIPIPSPQFKSPQPPPLPPHMFGNTLNPASSMAQQMVDSLSQEMKTIAENNQSIELPTAARNSASAAAADADRRNSSSNPLVGITFPGMKNVPGNATGSGKGPGQNQPQTLEDLLERQWEQGSEFLMEQAAHLDIAQLLSCLNQLKQDNRALEEHVATLSQRKEQLAAINARLSVPLNNTNQFVPGLNRAQQQQQPQQQPQAYNNPQPQPLHPEQQRERERLMSQRFHELQQQHNGGGGMSPTTTTTTTTAYHNHNHPQPQPHHLSSNSGRPSSTTAMNGPSQQQQHYNNRNPHHHHQQQQQHQQR